jgi:hypothetical protein
MVEPQTMNVLAFRDGTIPKSSAVDLQPMPDESNPAPAAQQFSCDQCQKCCPTEQQLNYHKIIHAGTALVPSTNGR